MCVTGVSWEFLNKIFALQARYVVEFIINICSGPTLQQDVVGRLNGIYVARGRETLSREYEYSRHDLLLSSIHQARIAVKMNSAARLAEWTPEIVCKSRTKQ